MTLAGVALAAGLGTRLRPLTVLRPKPLCPVNGVPLLDLAFDRLAPYVAGLAANASWLADQVVAHVGGRAHVSVEPERPLGSAGALGALREWLAGRDVLVTNADAYLPDGLADLVTGWEGRRPRLLVVPAAGGRGDFGPWRYVGGALLPWPAVRSLAPRFGGLYEQVWLPAYQAGELDLVPYRGTAIDCGTPADYLWANLHASGGKTVVGDGAVVEGVAERCVVWDGAWVGAEEHLVESVRAGDRANPVTVPAPLGSGRHPSS